MVILLSLASLGVRLGRNGREAWADYQKPLGGLHDGFCSKSVDVRILYGCFSQYKLLGITGTSCLNPASKTGKKTDGERWIKRELNGGQRTCYYVE